MVVAHLRGLLPQHQRHGLRSVSTEDVILESLAAEALSKGIESVLQVDLATLPLLTEKGVKNVVEKASARLYRATELRSLDIYKVGEQISRTLKLANDENELSLYQVYQIAEKSGIFEAFDEHYTEEKSKPLL